FAQPCARRQAQAPSGADRLDSLTARSSAEPDEHPPGLGPDRVEAEVLARGRSLGLTRLVVEAAVVLGALDDVALDQAVGQAGALVGAERIGGVEGVLRAAVDREGTPRALHLDDVLRLDVVDGAGLDPAVSEPLRARAAHASNTASCISGRKGWAAGGSSRRT